MSQRNASSESAIASGIQCTQALIAGGKLGEATQHACLLANRHPTDLRVWQLLSSVHSHAGRWQDAMECVKHALSISPHDQGSLLQFGQCMVATARKSDALDVAGHLAGLKLDRADWNDALGALFAYCDQPTRARPFFERAVVLAPKSSLYLYNLATAQRMTGDLAEAEVSLDRVIALQPRDVRAYYTRADLRTQTVTGNHIDEMLRLLNSGIKRPPDEVTLCFAIAKELEDVSRYEESFAYLKRGCDLQRRLMTYNVADDVSTIDRIIQLHDRAALESGVGSNTHEFIFVIGLPRSGTTLVERILASHSDVHGGGELQAFPAETIKAVERRVGRPVGKLEFVERTLEVDPNALGSAYQEATRAETGHKPRFIDKLPFNYLYAGLIRRSLPHARIVALARDPMDSCYAMYKALFSGVYPFSYDLSELCEYYVAWHRLMRHWKSVLGESMLLVQYEDLIADQESVSRRIITHCGLSWEDACLAFYESATAVTTASAVQVRRPMYSSSVGKWHYYERQLAPLAELIKLREPPGGWRLG